MKAENSVFLIGRVGQDPANRSVGEQTVTQFSIAVSDDYFDKRKNDWVERTYWHNVVVWKQVNFTKGALVAVSGKLVTESYEKEGRKITLTKVVADSIKVLVKGKENALESNYGSPKVYDDFPDPAMYEGADDLPF